MSQVPTGGKYLKGSSIKQTGETVKILNEADWEKGEYKGQETNSYVCEVDYDGETRKLKLTMASCNEIAPVYGKDSKEWIGKELKIEPIKVIVGGEVKLSILASPVGIVTTQPNKEAWDE